MPEMESIRFYYVVFWIRFRTTPLTAALRERLLSRFGLAAGRHGAVALAADGAADRLYALLGVHPRREPDSAIQGIREELTRCAGGSAEGEGLDWEEGYAAIPLGPEEVAALLDVASGSGFPKPPGQEEDGWWEADFPPGPLPREPVPAARGSALENDGEIIS